MRIASTLAVCLLLFAGFRLGAVADLGTALVVEAGADCLGYVRIENPKIFLEKLDAVTGKFGSRVSDDLPLFAAVRSAAVTPTAAAKPSLVEQALAEVDPDSLTPREALDLIYRLKNLAPK